MPVNKTAKSRAERLVPAPKRTRRVKSANGVEITPEEVASLEHQASLHQQAERAWLKLTEVPEEDDRWNAVEDHLLDKTLRDEHSERSWKYFSK